MFSKVKNPDNAILSNVKGNWDKLDKDCSIALGLFEKDLKKKKTSTIAAGSNFLEEASSRADYRGGRGVPDLFNEEPP